MKGEKKGAGGWRGFSAAAFVLLVQWQSVNATHSSSLQEREGYLCDRIQDGGVCVCVCEHVHVCSAFVAGCRTESLCRLLGECASACVCMYACLS